MLRLLRIRNLAVIEAVEVELEPGFNVLTGETGAGKSILVEAVGLLLGARASADLVRTGEAQATIEAIFEDAAGRRDHHPPGSDAARAAVAHSSTGRLQLPVRSVSWPTGWSNCTASTSISCFWTRCRTCRLSMSRPGSSRSSTRSRKRGASMRLLREQRDRARMDGREKAARLDLIAFQLGEIEKAAVKPGEDEELATTKQVLANAERIQRLCEESYADALRQRPRRTRRVGAGLETGLRACHDRAAVCRAAELAGEHQVAARRHGLLVASLRRRDPCVPGAPSAGGGSTGSDSSVSNESTVRPCRTS